MDFVNQVFKKAGFIHTEKEQIEKVFGKDTTAKQLLITKEMYFDNKDCDPNEWNSKLNAKLNWINSVNKVYNLLCLRSEWVSYD